ncbi:MAG: hypothetical protein HYY06_13415 [Deltaproteobacteria bacterium]|nr:hypothetical protein [Deltaproteobacteria bacterium]
MVDRICQDEGNRYRCHDNPAEAVQYAPSFGRMRPEAQAEITDALVEHATDEQFVRDVYALVTAPGAAGLKEDGWQAVLGALEEHRDEAAIARLREVVGDPGFQAMSGAEADEEAERAAEGTAFSPSAFAARSGVRARERSSWSWTGAAELGIHGAGEGAIAGLEHAAIGGAAWAGGAGAAAGVGAAAGIPVLFGIYAALHEIAEAHHEGDVLAANVQYAQGVVDGLEHNMGGDPPGAQSPSGARGSQRADELWERLSPSQRATLRALSPGDRQKVTEALQRLLVERRAIAGR